MRREKWSRVDARDGVWFTRTIERKIKTAGGSVILGLEECYFPDTEKHNLDLIYIKGYDADDEGYWKKRKIKVMG